MKFSLQVKYSIAILFLITFIVSILSYALFIQLKQSINEVTQSSAQSMGADLFKQLKKRGEILTKVLAEDLINPIYQYDMETIYSLVNNVRLQEDVISVYVYDTEGRIINDGTKVTLFLISY